MKFIRIAFAIAILALTPPSLSLGDSGPSKDETKAWIHENISRKIYASYDFPDSGKLTFDGDIMQVKYWQKDSILTYGHKVPVSDLEIRVGSVDYADRASIHFKCAFGKDCISEWTDLDMEDAFRSKSSSFSFYIENENNMPHRVIKAFEHLIRISGGKSPAKEKLF